MPSTRLKTTASGREYYEIRVSCGRGQPYMTGRWYVPDGWSHKAIERELARQAAEFERRVRAGEVENRAQKAEREQAEAAERAKLKTVRAYCDGVFMPAKEATLSETSRSGYRMFLDRHILPVLGDTLLVDVTPAMVTKLLLDFQKSGKAHASAVKLYNILNGVFQMAFLDDSIPMNPMLKVKRPAARKDEQKQQEAEKALTAERLRYVLDCVDSEPLQWRAFVHLLADTGMRRGEACGLQWSDVDFTTGTVTICRNLQYTAEAGIYAAAPKNGKTRRIDVGEDVLDLLRELRRQQSEHAISKWVFTQEGTAEPMHPTSPTHYFRVFGKKYGIPGFHPHLLRHTSASVAITNGADVVSVSERLGHSDKAVTLRLYTHANEDSMRRASEVFHAALRGKDEQPIPLYAEEK